MKTLKLAYQKLTNKSSNVSAHYLITRKGVIFNLLCPKYKAWHAGKSKWKNDENINNYSIGIELENGRSPCMKLCDLLILFFLLCI